MKELKQNQKVEFNVGGLKGTGRVVGKAQIEQPVIGGTYIIEPDVPVSNETYNYSHFVVPQINLTLID